MQSGLRIARFILTLGVLPLSCDETLPPREEPRDFLTAELTGESRTLQVRVYPDSIIDGVQQSLHIRVMNLYEEVLQDTAKVNGSAEVWMTNTPSQMVVLQGDHFNLIGPTQVRNGLLTLEPAGDQAERDLVHMVLSMGWTTSSGKFHWELVDTVWRTDRWGELYVQTAPIHFMARASMQVFKNVQAQPTNEIVFDLVYIVYGLPRP